MLGIVLPNDNSSCDTLFDIFWRAQPMSCIRVQKNRNLTTFTVIGEIERSDLEEMVLLFYTKNPSPHMLWDWEQASFAKLSSNDLHTLAEFTSEHMGERPFGKTAYVCSNDLQFGMSRLYSTYEELIGVKGKYGVFRSKDDAIAWIARGEGYEAKFEQ